MKIDFFNFQKCRILVVGDLMIDEYVWGQVERISPEAPVQVVSVIRENSTLGGAGNVVNNLTALGANVSVAGVVGSDRDGQLLHRLVEQLGVNTNSVLEVPDRPTTKKTRILAGHGHQQVLRIDRETKRPISVVHENRLIQVIEKKAGALDLILISDYGKGLLTTRFLKQLLRLAKERRIKTLVDPKGLNFAKYAGATAITPNKREASAAAGFEMTDEETLIAAGRKLRDQIPVETVLMTCGRDGMMLFEEAADTPFRITAQAKQVFDVSGAGDTVLAVLGLGLASGRSFREAAALANVAAGIVVGKVGTATVSQEELQNTLNGSSDKTVVKTKTLAELIPIVEGLKAEGKRIVVTNGCFDLLHVGHIQLLSASKQLGEVLIVAIDDDPSVGKLKGDGRPIIGSRERLRLINALDCVDYTIVFSTHELETLLETLRPDVLTKGSNYTNATVAGRKTVEKYGGRVALIPIAENVSTSGIISQIKGC